MTHLRTDDLGSSPEVSPSELDRLRETVTALTEAVHEYIASDARHQRRIDTLELRKALQAARTALSGDES